MKAQFKKLNLLVFHREREEITDMLQEIGVLDVKVDTEFRSGDVQELERQKNNFTKAIEVVEEQSGKKYQSIEKTEVSIEEVAKKVMELKYRNEENVQKRESLRKEKLQRLPWGDLNLEKLYRLQEHGLEAQFCMATLKEFINVRGRFLSSSKNWVRVYPGQNYSVLLPIPLLSCQCEIERN